MNYLPPIKHIHDSLSLREVTNTSSASGGGGGGATARCLLLGLATACSSTSGSLSPAAALARVLLVDMISADIIKTYFVLNNIMG